MSCACRISPWKTFITGLAQVHRLDTASSSSWLAASSRAAISSQRLAVTRQARPFHQSTHLYQQDAAAPSSSTSPAEVTEESSSTSNKTSNGAVAQPDETSKSPTSDAPRNLDFSALDDQPPRRDPYAYASRRAPSSRAKPTGRPDYASKKSPRWNTNPSPDQRDSRAPRSPRKGNTAQQRYRDDDATEGTPQPRKKEEWQIQKEALKQKFPEGWKPRKRLSPDALAGIRALNAQFPDIYTSRALSEKFEVSPENIRRILKSSWQPTPEEEESRQQRWHNRGASIWERRAAMGHKAPKKWREEGITRDPGYEARRKHAIRKEREWEEEETRKYQEMRRRMNRGPGSGV